MTSVEQAPRPVRSWLLAGMALIACMVVIGGITRLTGSGLSITEWKPIMGALPPMDELEWNEAFKKYQAIPEYRLKNHHMDLAGFKQIFFWEYLHRNWGRLMGLVFIVPFLVFLRRGWLKGWLLRRTLLILVGGGLVGALGWFMVASGLADRPDVSHYRLAIHLCAAFTVYLLVWWTVLDLDHGRRAFVAFGQGAGPVYLALALVVLQVIWGAFTAGMDAGRIYNTWPLMNGEWMPDNVLAHGSLWTDLTDHRDGVQFVHRCLAWLVAGVVVALGWRRMKDAEPEGRWARSMLALVLLQFTLGVMTLLWQVPLWLGVAHQLGALALLTSVVALLHCSERPVYKA
ncbi:MAG: COX15/CtaA family protein [Flavobacteriales bacterium]|nr:COX15/CtaA family protein [Flavobacteriales bacterium]